jgi:hypothetical protein
MSKAVKKVARIALPVIGTIVAPGIGTALGSALSGASLAAIGGAVGGGLGGAIGGGGIKGALTGAALGGVGGYIGGGGLGSVAGTPLATTSGQAALQGPTAGTGILGSITRTGIGSSLARALPSSGGSLFGGGLTSPLGIGNTLLSLNQADAAEEAAKLQAQSVDRAIQTQQQNTAPYRQLGEDAIGRINEIQNDRAGFIQNNELYQSLANDAEQRLLANQAAKGKVGSGGTAAALQEQLLNIGNGLVNQEINQLQGQAGIGANAAVGAGNQISNLQVQQGNAQAAGQIGQANALSSGYQNQINTLLALQSLNKTPVYQPASI